MINQTKKETSLFMSDEVYNRLSVRYALVLSTSRDFIVKKKKTKTGGTISPIRKQSLESSAADCPQCGQIFRGANHNTEHIHDKALGGAKACSKNRIQLCKMCNNSRASTMLAFLGNPPYYHNLEIRWPKIIAYLLWSEMTIDEGLQAGELIPEIHTLFLEARFAGQRPDGFVPNRAYGRFSTWGIGDSPNYRHNSPKLMSPQRRSPPSLTKPTPTISSILSRMSRTFFDKLFDYNPEPTPEPTSSLDTDLDEPESHSKVKKLSETPLFGKEKHPRLTILDVVEIQRRWQTKLEAHMTLHGQEILLGLFWDMVVQVRIDSGLAWRAFENAFEVNHKQAMPGKATQFLEQMGYSFIFSKQEKGYLVLFIDEEE